MKHVAVVFWSGTGNTEAMADLVAQGARDAGAEVEVFPVADFNESQVAAFDAVAFGCPAMGNEELEELEFEPVYEACEAVLGETPVALFGSFDWNDGEWMENWESRAHDAGLNVVGTAISRDYPDDEAETACKELGSTLAA
jgi:flavodoxin I